MTKSHIGAAWHGLAKMLVSRDHVAFFGMVGEGDGLLEAVSEHGVQPNYFRTQYAAAAAAYGFVKGCNHTAVYVTCSGPGVTNSLTPILEAYSSATPMLIIGTGTGQYGMERGGFQALESVGLMAAVTKWQFRVQSVDQAAWAVRRALYLSRMGRPGPVYLEIDASLLNSEIFAQEEMDETSSLLACAPSRRQIGRVAAALATARRPIVVVGGGCQNANITSYIVRISELTGAALFVTASGRGVIPENANTFCGLAGLYTLPEVMPLISEADIFLFVGCQMEETMLMGWGESISHSVSIQVNKDPEVFHRATAPSIGVIGDSEEVLAALSHTLKEMSSETPAKNLPWIDRVTQCKDHLFQSWSSVDFSASPVRCFFNILSSEYGSNTIVVQENGLSDMWGYFYPVLQLGEGSRTIVPGEQTALGLSLGAAVGAKLANPSTNVIAVLGDGALQTSPDALMTAMEMELGITYVCINNGGFGWPRLAGNHRAESIGCNFRLNWDWADNIAKLGGETSKPTSAREIRSALKRCIGANQLGRVGFIEIETAWNHDIPYGVTFHYGQDGM